MEALRSGVVRTVFLVLVVGFAWWGLRHRGHEVAEALRGTSPLGVVLALVLVLAGLLVTGLLWRHVLARYGHRLGVADALSIFFVGQLGKYVPGSVWSLGVQARMATVHRVPARTTVGASLVFLVLHLATGLLVGAVLGSWVDLAEVRRVLLVLVCLVAGVLALVPSVLRPLGRRMAGVPLSWQGRDTAVAVSAMGVVWLAYSLAVVALLPASGRDAFAAAAVAFALGYVAGVAVPFAPAGIGAREVVFLAVLAPVAGVGTAAAVALLARVVHTVADFLLAATAWWAARHAARGAEGTGLSEAGA